MINPEVLAWAREDAGFDLETAAQKAQVTSDRLLAWEAGSDRPTINQLRKLGRVYKRPIAVFYLSAPPKRFQAMHDYRHLPGDVAATESHELRTEIRRARYRRSVALELFRELGESLLPVIVVNLKDSPRGRVFSMMHELVHIALRKAGLCDLSDAPLPTEERRVEAFCNHVAGAILVPRAQLLDDKVVREHEPEDPWSDDELKQVSRRFQVSEETVLRRLLILARTTERFYAEKRRLYLKFYQSRQTGKGFVPPPRRVVSQAGKLFTRLVLEGYYQEIITSSSVADHLDVRLKHLPAIEQMILGHTAEFGAAFGL